VTRIIGGATAVVAVESVLIMWLLRHRAAGSLAPRLLTDRLRFETYSPISPQS
jgi:hypothetical protein